MRERKRERERTRERERERERTREREREREKKKKEKEKKKTKARHRTCKRSVNSACAGVAVPSGWWRPRGEPWQAGRASCEWRLQMA